MISTLTGPINAPLLHLANTVVKSATFLALVGEPEAPATAAQALSRFHPYDIPEPELPGGYDTEEHHQHRPLCTVAPTQPGAMEIQFRTPHSPISGGTIEWGLELDVPAGMVGDGEILVWFTETLGGILSDMLAVSAAGGDMGGLLNITKIAVVAFDRAEEEKRITQGDHVWAALDVSWGNG